VTVEDALLLSIKDEVRKERTSPQLSKKKTQPPRLFSGFTPKPNRFTGAIPQRETSSQTPVNQSQRTETIHLLAFHVPRPA